MSVAKEDRTNAHDDATDEIMDRLVKSVTQNPSDRPSSPKNRKRSRLNRKSSELHRVFTLPSVQCAIGFGSVSVALFFLVQEQCVQNRPISVLSLPQ